MRFVMVAGPNEPEIVYAYELANIFPEFSEDEIGLWMRTEEGDLEPVEFATLFLGQDDRFRYYDTVLTLVDGTQHTVQWDQRRNGRD